MDPWPPLQANVAFFFFFFSLDLKVECRNEFEGFRSRISC